MVDYLTANPALGRAWAGAQGIPTGELGAYINSLTPVLLRSDTRVTNHGYSRGRATAHQSVLQAGTAVLVDQYGVPRARCACGNPLLPPRSVSTTPQYTGPKWEGFSPTNVTVVVQNTTVINVITLIDVTTGQPFGRPTGPRPGPDVPVPQPPPGGQTPPPAGAGDFLLVEPPEQTITELASSWTVDARAGTARLAISAGEARR
jgi:hypothetical protein